MIGELPVWYDTTLGVRPFDLDDGVEFDGTTDQKGVDTLFTTANVNPALNVNRTVNSLWIDSPSSGKFVDMNGKTLTITSGRILHTGSDDFELGQGTGTLSPGPSYSLITVTDPHVTLTLNATTAKPFAKDGPGTLLLNGDYTATRNPHSIINQGSVRIGPNASFASGTYGSYFDINGGVLDTAGYSHYLGSLTILEGGVTNSQPETSSEVTTRREVTLGGGRPDSSSFIDLGPNATLKLIHNVAYSAANHPGMAYIAANLDLNGASRTFTVGNSVSHLADIDLELRGPLSGSPGNGIIKNGAGAMRLTQANTSAGDLTVSGGILMLSHPQAGGTPSAARTIAISAGASLYLDGSNGNITLPAAYKTRVSGVGSPILDGISGALVNSIGDNTIAGDVESFNNSVNRIAAIGGSLTINGNVLGETSKARDIDIYAQSAITINGNMLAPLVAVDKRGGGRLTLRGNNTFTGATTLWGGVLNIQHNNALGTTGSGTSVRPAATLELAGNITVTGEALTLGRLTTASGSRLLFELSDAPANDTLIISSANGLTLAAGTEIELRNAADSTPGRPSAPTS